MFANTQMSGQDIGFPDVCLTPAPPAPAPVPVPYPNMALRPMGIPTVLNILILGMPVHNLSLIIPVSNGDNAGIATGVASGTVMGPCRKVTGSFTTLWNNMPAARVTSVTMQNSTNCPGISGPPSQTNVLILKP